ncbi:PREDICTED: uncharacterized protein LOC109180722 [Ipomoea nil]|uniref:uncharacterized protein LOC109180722 n=1 Tax=Ipomoea nil TaxID=35883 RepID=UPI000901DD06|nr:PREDICTED: uncharacterized protein LOC109180722 [Ipomoea nil]
MSTAFLYVYALIKCGVAFVYSFSIKWQDSVGSCITLLLFITVERHLLKAFVCLKCGNAFMLNVHCICVVRMNETVELIIHHGGNFVQKPKLKYLNGETEVVRVDPDVICYPHLLKYITNQRYGKITSLTYKSTKEPFKALKLLNNDASSLHLAKIAVENKRVEIYVEHGVDEPEVVGLCLPGTGVQPEAELGAEEGGAAYEVEGELGAEEGGAAYEVEGELGAEEGGAAYEVEGELGAEEGGAAYEVEGELGAEEGGAAYEVEGELGAEEGGAAYEVEGEDVSGGEDYGFGSDYDTNSSSEHLTSGSEHDSEVSEQTTRVKRKRKVRLDPDPIPQYIPTPINPLEAEGDSVYYDSQDPPTVEADLENKEGVEVQSKYNDNYPKYNPKSDPPFLELGMYLDDNVEFKLAMISYAVHTKRDLFWKKNQLRYVRVECLGKGCAFHVSAGWEERTKCFQVKSIMVDHKCNNQFTLGIVNQKWLEWKFEEKVRQNPTIGYSELSRDIKSEMNINVSVSMCRRAVNGILKMLDIGYESQFKNLRDYAQECLNSNPGSTVKIQTTMTVPTSPVVFQRIYVCFNAMMKGFLEGCRRFIGLDGCFLKGKLKGEILTAVGRDGNNQMYPIAWAVVEIENSSSWTWFLNLLKTDLKIVDSTQWTLMSDQQKGLANVIQELFPGVEHRNCARHVHANWSKKHKGKVLKAHFWQIAKTPTEALLAEKLKDLEKVDAGALHDLKRYPMQNWCKAYFKEEVKCDMVDNNLSEAYNRTLLAAWSKNIIPMLEDIRVAVMKRIAKKKAIAERWSGNFGTNVLKKLNENILGSADWEIIFNGVDGYEVKRGRFQFKINLELRTCSCRLWQLTGVPCPHSICAIFHRGHQPDQYIHEWYTKEVYLKTYEHVIQPINGEQFWPRTEGDEIQAPVPRKMTGRPKKKKERLKMMKRTRTKTN